VLSAEATIRSIPRSARAARDGSGLRGGRRREIAERGAAAPPYGDRPPIGLL